MRVLVSGSSGHVGGAIAAHLVSVGYGVIGLSRRLSHISGLSQEIQADIASEGVADRVSNEFPSCSAIVHAAASLDKDIYASAISLANCLGTQQMLRLASMWNTRNFIYISSVPVVGLPHQVPITEDHPTCPLTAYHASKLYGEHLVRLAERKDFLTSMLRLTSPVGPKMPGNRILSVFIQRALSNEVLQILGKGTRRQNYVDVRDVAQAVEACLREGVSGRLNIASDVSISNYELAQTCIRALGSSSSIEFSGKPDPEEGIVWDVSIDKAKNRFGYRPQFTIEDSIRAVASEYAHRLS